jgi:hypothetical protein
MILKPKSYLNYKPHASIFAAMHNTLVIQLLTRLAQLHSRAKYRPLLANYARILPCNQQSYNMDENSHNMPYNICGMCDHN